jgi:hypothetical protein
MFRTKGAMMRIRELAVVVAAVLGAVAGFYLAGARATPAAIAENPDLLTAWGNGPIVWAVVAGLALPWVVNRWVEHRPSPEGTPGASPGR